MLLLTMLIVFLCGWLTCAEEILLEDLATIARFLSSVEACIPSFWTQYLSRMLTLLWHQLKMFNASHKIIMCLAESIDENSQGKQTWASVFWDHEIVSINSCTGILKNSFPVGFAVHSDSSVVVMLVGNKSDLAHVREVTVEEGTALAEQHNMSFIETSALESVNVINAFQTVLREIHKIVSRKALAPDATKDNTVLSSGHKLAGSDEMTPRRGGCCSMV